jgi:hypothetical protein
MQLPPIRMNLAWLPIRFAYYGFIARGPILAMSTEHQRYSPENQSEAIATYAGPRHIEIVRTYEDLGRSGLSLSGRRGLLTLLEDVADHRNDFSLLLVYDVSRWGRFQDADESAYYEYVLKKAGVLVHYCAEEFVNAAFLTICPPSIHSRFDGMGKYYLPCSGFSF